MIPRALPRIKARLANTLMTFLAASLIATSARADDAAIKKQLVGYWKGPDDITIVVNDDGTIIYSGSHVKRWDVRNGVFHTRFHDDKDSFKIISLTKTKFVIQDMFHGRNTGTWTRIMASKAKH